MSDAAVARGLGRTFRVFGYLQEYDMHQRRRQTFEKQPLGFRELVELFLNIGL